MKRGLTILVILILLATPLMLAAENKTVDIKEITKEAAESAIKDNPWNETKTISPVWQTLIGGFFGLNLHNESTEITVRETIVFIMTFIMFFIIILDILKMTPLFKTNFLGGDIISGISGESIAALIITTIVSITGVFINLKNLLQSGIAYLIVFLDWEWLTNAIANRTLGNIMVGMLILILIFIIHEGLSLLEPIIKKYSQVSRAEAQGRMVRNKIEETNPS